MYILRTIKISFSNGGPFRPFYCIFWALSMTISLMLVAEDEINKPGATFKLLEQRVTALEKENDQLKMRISILEEKKVLQPKELADILPKEEKE